MRRAPYTPRVAHAQAVEQARHIRARLLPLVIDCIANGSLPPKSRRTLIRLHAQVLRDAYHDRMRAPSTGFRWCPLP